jgi:thiol-disulfide isomerase/thioredoxin
VAKELLAKVRAEAKEETAKKLYDQADRMFAGLQKSIETARRLAALIGQNAAPLDVEAWVNGTALTDADLKGKVVLLDFWAVWCGPCIATFPHLREWQEKYGDKGLVIVGLTRYYGFVWDEKQGRATPPAAKPRPPQEPGAAPPAAPPAEPPEKPSPAQEQEMLVTFAEHHKLHHRFAIQKDNALPEYYAVSGIPHVVVIDGEGKIRLIRVGSGEKNAQDVAAMLASLIGDGAGTQ